MSLLLLGAVGLAPISLGISGAIIDLGAATLMFSVAAAIIICSVLLGFAAGVPGQMRDGEPA
jgi:hypothetical protein